MAYTDRHVHIVNRNGRQRPKDIGTQAKYTKRKRTATIDLPPVNPDALRARTPMGAWALHLDRCDHCWTNFANGGDLCDTGRDLHSAAHPAAAAD